MSTVISRSDAIREGLARYFTGKPCPHGHISERYANNAVCIACNFIYTRSESQKAARKIISMRPEARAAQHIRARKYRHKNRDRILAKMAVRNKRYYELNKTKIIAQTSEYQRKNSAARNAYKSKWSSNRVKADPEFAMLMVMRKSVTRMLDRIKAKRTQGARTTAIVGYTPAEFVAHIEPMFKPGMTWENHGKWHVDHRRPLASFDLTDPEQRRLANSLHNLQPMWARRNLKKSDRWSGQASLI